MKLFNWLKNTFRGGKMNNQLKEQRPDLIFNTAIREKQEDYFTWYEGDSNKLIKRYLESVDTTKAGEYQEFRNTKDYFWAVASKEKNVKCTHSSIPRTIVQTLIKLLGKPDFKITDADGDEVIHEEKRLLDILEESNFYDTLKQLQEPLTMVIGDGVYLPSIDREISDSPIIEFIDGRNVNFEWKANKIVGVTVRRFYQHEKKGYCLFERRGTITENVEGIKKRKATIEYKLFTLKNSNTEEINQELSLKTIPQTVELEDLVFNHIDTMLAVPTIFDLDIENKRGLSMFASKLDLFDDLDQTLSQASNTVRLSTPVEYFPEGLIDNRADGRIVAPNRYDRRYVTVPGDRNSVGQNTNKVETTQPELQFDKYNENALEILHNILSGLISPATLGIDLARDDNATAQREKEKVTLVTRDFLVDRQMQILTRLFRLVLKIDDFMKSPNQPVKDYQISINYPEYANPTFDAKIASLAPALNMGGISPKKYVEELWGDSLSEDEKQEEIDYITKSRTPTNANPMTEGLDLGINMDFEDM